MGGLVVASYRVKQAFLDLDSTLLVMDMGDLSIINIEDEPAPDYIILNPATDSVILNGTVLSELAIPHANDNTWGHFNVVCDEYSFFIVTPFGRIKYACIHL